MGCCCFRSVQKMEAIAFFQFVDGMLACRCYCKISKKHVENETKGNTAFKAETGFKNTNR